MLEPHERPLANREPEPEALDWIESEATRLIGFQQEDGTIERCHGDGNWSRTLLLVSLAAPPGWKGRLRFDHARHRRELNFQRNYVRLNEWPEWFTVDENTLYRPTDATDRDQVRLSSELKQGIEVASRLVVEPISTP